MIQITHQMRILASIAPQEFSKRDLSGVCRNLLKSDPFSGSLIVFRNKGGTAIKVLVIDTRVALDTTE